MTWQPVFIVAVGIVAYHNSFDGAFVFDDAAHIHASPRIQQLWPIWPLLGGRRPTVDLTLALNYAVGAYEVWGYHLLNLIVHVLAALMLFGVIRRSLFLRPLRERYAASSTWLAAIVALMWVAHPLNTQAVTYIIQRGESLMGLCYMTTLYCVVRGATASRRRVWFVAAIISCALGMASKAVMMTAPVAVLLYDRTFLSGSFVSALKRRWWLYSGLFATIAILFACGVLQGVLDATPRPNTSVGLGFKGITPFQYALTEPGVLVYYLRLALWPDPLCFDYAWPVARTASDIAPAAAVVVSLLAVTLWAIVRHPHIGFAGAWLFLILAPTSSVMPIRDPLVEHRMYLPLAAVILLIVLAGHALFVRGLRANLLRPKMLHWGTAFTATVVVAVLVVLTIRRNTVYADDVSLWRDVTVKRSYNARGFLNLGTATINLQDAVRAYETAVAIDPGYADAHFNLGQAYRAMGRLTAAGEAYRLSAKLDPTLSSSAFLNLGLVLTRQNRLDEAADAYHICLDADSTNYKAHFNLGNLAARQGLNHEAIEQFKTSIDLAPSFAQARVNLARILQRVGRWDEAREQLEQALALLPDRRRVEVHVQLGAILVQLGSYQGAAAQYEAALRLDPTHARAKRGLTALNDGVNR